MTDSKDNAKMQTGKRFQVLVSVAALAMSGLTGYALSETASHALASPESFAAIGDGDKRSAAIFTELGNSLFTADPTQPMSSLPLIIYEFARSPYPEQQKLAWTGALIVTATVLTLSVSARLLSTPRGRQK